MKVGMYRMFLDTFHVVTSLLDDYGAIQLDPSTISNVAHYNSILATNLYEVQIPNTPSSIFMNLFNSIKFLLYINIGFFGCRYYVTVLWQLHIETKIIDLKWFHFYDSHVIDKYMNPMAYFLYVMSIFYFS